MIVQLKDDEWLANARIAGKVAAGALTLLKDLIKASELNVLRLNKLAEEYIEDNGCFPTFRGYKGFPAGVCISINEELVHGVPKDRDLQENDVVSFDLGATYKGSIADTAITCIVGKGKEEHIRLVQATKDALDKAIASIQVGKHLGVIGHTIYEHAKKCNYTCITRYGGHSIAIAPDGTGIPHVPPFVANRAEINEGMILCAGLVLAIEPLFTLSKSDETIVDPDDHWTVSTPGGISSHHEHSIFIHDDKVEVFTARGE
jgi:methionyl aminopeptidase